jgi:hypothetical protein
MAKFPIPEYCSAYVPMILKAFCSSKINGLVMKTFSWKYDKTVFFCYSLKLNFICYRNRFFTYDYSLWDGEDIRFCGQKQILIPV